MNEIVCLKGVSFDRKYFHSTALTRGKDPAREEYHGNLLVAVNFIVPNIAGNQGILNTMFLKESTPIGTVDLYLSLLDQLLSCIRDGTICGLPGRDMLIEEHLTADEKALIAKAALDEVMEKPTVPPTHDGGTIPPQSQSGSEV